IFSFQPSPRSVSTWENASICAKTSPFPLGSTVFGTGTSVIIASLSGSGGRCGSSVSKRSAVESSARRGRAPADGSSPRRCRRDDPRERRCAPPPPHSPPPPGVSRHSCNLTPPLKPRNGNGGPQTPPPPPDTKARPQPLPPPLPPWGPPPPPLAPKTPPPPKN